MLRLKYSDDVSVQTKEMTRIFPLKKKSSARKQTIFFYGSFLFARKISHWFLYDDARVNNE